MNYIPASPSAMYVRAVQPDAPHMAGFELEMARQTQALWYHCSGYRRHFHYIEASRAPQAQLTTNLTWTRFQMYKTGTGATNWDYQVAFPYHVRAVAVRAVVHYVTQRAAPVRLRLRSSTFINSVTAVSGSDGGLSSTSQVVGMPRGPWADDSISTGYYPEIVKTELEIIPNVDTDRRLAVMVEAEYDSPTYPYNASIVVPVWIYSVELSTVMATPGETAP